MTRGALHEGTKPRHHQIETQTKLGRHMVLGTPTLYQYAGWLRMKAAMFALVEPWMPPACRRSSDYAADAERTGISIPVLTAISSHALWLSDEAQPAEVLERRRTGTIYVCAGSVFGSEVIRSRLVARHPDWPVSSLRFRCKDTEISYLSQLRHRSDCVEEANAAFCALISACEEITDAEDLHSSASPIPAI